VMGSGVAGRPSPAPCDPATLPPTPDFRLLLTKLQGYRERRDSEIWFIHPYERTLTIWRRQPDESYAEEIYRGGVVPVASLPGVVIDFDALLDG
jgi:Putative restriction endonuclease